MSVQTDAKVFREVLGHYSTGVCVITSVAEDREPLGMAAGSFTYASLEPPLVGFFTDRTSTTWPRIQATDRFA